MTRLVAEQPVRVAGAEEAAELAAFYARFPMAGAALRYRVERAPDYFALSRLQGHTQRVLRLGEQAPLGVMSLVVDRVFIEAAPRDVAFTADLRVEAAARGRGIGDRLMREAIAQARAMLGPDAPVFTAVANDNPAGRRANARLGEGGVTAMRVLAPVHVHFLAPWAPPGRGRGYDLRPAREEDLPAMLGFWQTFNGRKDFARAFTPESFRAWVLETPGLGLEAFRLAFDRAGRLAGFMGLWDQAAVRRVVLDSAHPAAALAGRAWNALRGRTNGPAFPRPGEALACMHAVSVCAAEAPALEALLAEALGRAREQGALFVSLALDARDPLDAAPRRFLAARTEMSLLGNERLPDTSLTHVEFALG